MLRLSLAEISPNPDLNGPNPDLYGLNPDLHGLDPDLSWTAYQTVMQGLFMRKDRPRGLIPEVHIGNPLYLQATHPTSA